MSAKKAKALRKRIGLQLPVEADYRIAKRVNKLVRFTDKLGNVTAIRCERIQVVNAAKYQYRQIKKIFKGMR